MKLYNWKLTSDELDTIYRALQEREERYRKEAKQTGNPDTHVLKEKLANKCTTLIEQINKMRFWQ